MPAPERIIYAGEKFSIEWYYAPNGRSQAKEYYDGLTVGDRAKALALFKRMADIGQIFDATKSTRETEKLHVFKPQPHRFFCFFVKGQKVPARETERAERLRRQCLDRIREGDYYGDET